MIATDSIFQTKTVHLLILYYTDNFLNAVACWVKNSADYILKYFFLIFARKQDLTFYANCLLRTICMRCQILFSGKDIINLLPAELALSVVKINSLYKH